MKTFRYKLGHVAGKTMTVAELRAKLSEYPDDMPVMALWEGCYAYINPENFDDEKVHKGYLDDECDVLTISVDEH